VHVGERIEGATLICIDVMERYRAREEREALIRELGERNAELESFTYTVSHDLRSPLVTMKGFLGAVVSAARAGDLALVESDAARIRGAADRMDRLLRELLELSRIGRLREAHERLELRALVEEARELVSGRLEARGVAVEVEEALPGVYGERRRIVQLLQNLLDNAAKFMGEQQRPLVRVGARRDGPAPVFYVCDNGIGIEPEHRERIFGLFDRLESGDDGTGVGLAIAKRVVETHGGRIWVESRGRGSGSCFCFTLAGAEPAGAP
jgi:signal transduction histidine kinase